ncbi:MAG: hypothetical protein K2H45_03325 [Acetatifactor sp.]|nr:hypothetical protein [Acetatifactor sp.]
MDKRYTKIDLLKDILFTLLIGVLMYVYWAFTLMVASIILVNVWHVTWQQLIFIALGLTLISLAFYVVHLVKKRKKGK